MRAVDTNVVVRLIVRDQPKQTDSAEQFVSKSAWVSHLVLAETSRVLDSVYEIDAEGIATAVDMLLNHEHLTVQEADVVARALQRFRESPVVGFSDHLIVEIARKSGHLPVGTFDRNLSKQEGTQRL